MYLQILRAYFVWMALSGVMHFGADVVSPYLRHTRSPSVETTFYFGMHTAFAFGHVAVGLLGLLAMRQSVELAQSTALLSLAVATALGWFSIAVAFLGFLPPKLNAGLLCLMVTAAAIVRLRT